jgi:hypothetical protein
MSPIVEFVAISAVIDAVNMVMAIRQHAAESRPSPVPIVSAALLTIILLKSSRRSPVSDRVVTALLRWAVHISLVFVVPAIVDRLARRER